MCVVVISCSRFACVLTARDRAFSRRYFPRPLWPSKHWLTRKNNGLSWKRRASKRQPGWAPILNLDRLSRSRSKANDLCASENGDNFAECRFGKATFKSTKHFRRAATYLGLSVDRKHRLKLLRLAQKRRAKVEFFCWRPEWRDRQRMQEMCALVFGNSASVDREQ